MRYWIAVALLLISPGCNSSAAVDDSEIVRYAKAIDVAILDEGLPSTRLDDWLSTGSPRLDRVEWDPGNCDVRPEGQEPADGWPLCIRVNFGRHDVWGWTVIRLGTIRAGIRPPPRVMHIVVTSRAAARRGHFVETKRLSELQKLIAEFEEADQK